MRPGSGEALASTRRASVVAIRYTDVRRHRPLRDHRLRDDGHRAPAATSPTSPGATVTAIADPARGLAATGPGSPHRTAPASSRSPTTRELLASGLCDAVVIATPNMTHHDVLLDVLATDLHVLVEKPLCTTVERLPRRHRRGARDDRESCGSAWSTGTCHRCRGWSRRCTAARSDACGCSAIREHRFPFLRKVGDWNRFDRNTGGTLVEKCCHFFDLMNHIAGARPVRVMASRRPGREPPRRASTTARSPTSSTTPT